MVVLVTGANGQLGQAIHAVAKNFSALSFVFCSSSELDITNIENCKTIFRQYQPKFCINAAAFTAVDKAESDRELAYKINVEGVKNLAETCLDFNTVLVHISTDFVFDGSNTTPYTETDKPNPTGVYGLTKLEGEKVIESKLQKYFIVRTSWVYSAFGNNFMKTMLRLAHERDSLTVVNDQIGTPTNAVDLAEALIKIILSIDIDKPLSIPYGIYHYSNLGECSWHDFAKEIFRINNISIDLKPIPTSSFPTPAKRPSYSVMNKTKIQKTFGIEIKSWEESLKIISKT